MVAYNFQSQLAPKIRALEKRTTIRAPRQHSRHARTGKPVQLYTGMRTRHCEKLLTPDPLCVEILPILLDLDIDQERFRIVLDGTVLVGQERKRIARLDGFDNSIELITFFDGRYDFPFEGFWIRWDPR